MTAEVSTFFQTLEFMKNDIFRHESMNIIL